MGEDAAALSLIRNRLGSDARRESRKREGRRATNGQPGHIRHEVVLTVRADARAPWVTPAPCGAAGRMPSVVLSARPPHGGQGAVDRVVTGIRSLARGRPWHARHCGQVDHCRELGRALDGQVAARMSCMSCGAWAALLARARLWAERTNCSLEAGVFLSTATAGRSTLLGQPIRLRGSPLLRRNVVARSVPIGAGLRRAASDRVTRWGRVDWEGALRGPRLEEQAEGAGQL